MYVNILTRIVSSRKFKRINFLKGENYRHICSCGSEFGSESSGAYAHLDTPLMHTYTETYTHALTHTH